MENNKERLANLSVDVARTWLELKLELRKSSNSFHFCDLSRKFYSYFVHHTMGEEYEVFIKSSVRGYAYFVDASVTILEVLACEREDNYAHDKYPIAVKNEAQLLVGHVPRELSKIFSRFLTDYGDIEAECIGVR